MAKGLLLDQQYIVHNQLCLVCPLAELCFACAGEDFHGFRGQPGGMPPISDNCGDFLLARAGISTWNLYFTPSKRQESSALD
jgi:hypothetical protein